VSDPCLETPPPGLLKGIEQFNRRELFECHETLERLWMDEPRSIRRLYQGILQVGVAFHHLQAGRYRPVVTLLKRGSQYLEPYAPLCMGVNIDDLLGGLARCLAAVQELGQDGLNRFNWSLVPRIETNQLGQDKNT
jgi:predicted metal-dependent hydrolase